MITEDQFRADAKAFLDANAERRVEEKFEWGKGSDRVGLLEEKTPEQEAAEISDAKAWKAKEFDAGFGWITGPEEYGGQALTAAHDRAYREVASAYAIPNQTIFGIGLGMVAPTILAHAIPEVRERYLQPMHRGDLVGCQLFSEPVAGSDLAGIQTKAVRDGDEWVLTGQKVWTSGAHYSDIGEIITRTSPDKPKHKGLTMFLVDMKAPGVDVRPLRQMTGGASLQRGVLRGGARPRLPPPRRRRRRLDRRAHDPDERARRDRWRRRRRRLVELHPVQGAGRSTRRRRRPGRSPAARRHLHPLQRSRGTRTSERWRRSAPASCPARRCRSASSCSPRTCSSRRRCSASCSGPASSPTPASGAPTHGRSSCCGIPGMRVAGGTDEIMRNIVGERVLGLPKEPRGTA